MIYIALIAYFFLIIFLFVSLVNTGFNEILRVFIFPNINNCTSIFGY